MREVADELEEAGKGGIKEAARAMFGMGKSAEELESELEKLEKRQDDLLDAILGVNQGLDDNKQKQDEGKTVTSDFSDVLNDQKDVWKELNQAVKDWNTQYDAYKGKLGEDREKMGEFGKLFGIQSLFPSEEEWDEARTTYDTNLEELSEQTGVHYQGLSSAQSSYLANYVKAWEKSGKQVTKGDKKHQQILQSQAQQTAQLQIQTAQLVAQTMIAISGDQTGAIFYIARAFAVVQAIINAWVAYTQALAHPPGPPTTIPVAKWALASGLVAAALIGAQTIAGKQSGGLLQGGSGVRDDIYLGTIGQTAYMAQGGEYIVNKEATRENLGLLEDINAGRTAMAQGGGDITLHNYITVELEGETLGQFVDTRVYEQSKAGARVVHRRGIVT
jgi:hypothetical protein